MKKTFLSVALITLAISPVSAQEGGIRIKLKAEPTAAPVKVQRAVDQRVKPQPGKGKGYTLTTGALSVVSEPSAIIYLQAINTGKYIDKIELPANQSQAIFESLKPARYKIVAELDGFVDAEGEVVVTANKIQPFELRLKPELYTVSVKTNVPTGKVQYRLNKTAETPRVVNIVNNKATISGLRAGEYEVDIKADDAAYETILATIDVGKGKTEFPVSLEYKLCEQTFSELWSNLNAWEAPAGWRTENSTLKINNAAGIALPKDKCPRNFADFELTTDVKLVNNHGVSFVLRAVDKKNYYLIQLTGEKAAEPLLLRGFAYVNGEPKTLVGGVPLSAFAPNIKGKFFAVVIKAKANVFKVFIHDSESGEEFPLGDLLDPSKHFAIGAVGIANNGNENTEIFRFIVKPTSRQP